MAGAGIRGRCISSLTGADLLAGPLRKKALGKGNAEKLMYGHCTGSNGHRRLTIRPEDAVFRSPMPRTCNLSREPLHTCIAFLLPPAGLSESCRPRLESSPAPRPVSCADGPRDAPLQCIAELSVTNWILSTSPRIGLGSTPRAGVAIGDWVLELHELARQGIFDAHPQTSPGLQDIFLQPASNSFAALPADERRWIRSTIIENLSSSNSLLFTDPSLDAKAFVSMRDVEMHLPMKITDYTDSFSSLIHAQNSLHPLGLELPPAFTEYPMGYNGRLSSIRLSGTDLVRPSGFYLDAGKARPMCQPSRQLDFEIELGAFISKPIEFGTSVDAKSAANHIFGYVLHNDWSARDIQKYEMPPLGPLHSKGFIKTISH